jgi:hypothetical protein
LDLIVSGYKTRFGLFGYKQARLAKELISVFFGVHAGSHLRAEDLASPAAHLFFQRFVWPLDPHSVSLPRHYRWR